MNNIIIIIWKSVHTHTEHIYLFPHFLCSAWRILGLFYKSNGFCSFHISTEFNGNLMYAVVCGCCCWIYAATSNSNQEKWRTKEEKKRLLLSSFVIYLLIACWHPLWCSTFGYVKSLQILACRWIEWQKRKLWKIFQYFASVIQTTKPAISAHLC